MPFKNQHPLYHVWRSMRDRCMNPKSRAWNDYGGRGIKICERWNDFKTFAADMGDKPEGHSLDRIDNNGGYSRENCRWADKKTQQRNRRVAVYVTVEGKKYRALELASIAGVKTDTIVSRAKRGLPYDQVVSPKWLTPDYAKLIPIVVERAKATKAAKTHCKKGHEYNDANTYVTPEGWRSCRVCRNERLRNERASWK